jgi:hypothetical protein
MYFIELISVYFWNVCCYFVRDLQIFMHVFEIFKWIFVYVNQTSDQRCAWQHQKSLLAFVLNKFICKSFKAIYILINAILSNASCLNNIFLIEKHHLLII